MVLLQQKRIKEGELSIQIYLQALRNGQFNIHDEISIGLYKQGEGAISTTHRNPLIPSATSLFTSHTKKRSLEDVEHDLGVLEQGEYKNSSTFSPFQAMKEQQIMENNVLNAVPSEIITVSSTVQAENMKKRSLNHKTVRKNLFFYHFSPTFLRFFYIYRFFFYMVIIFLYNKLPFNYMN